MEASIKALKLCLNNDLVLSDPSYQKGYPTQAPYPGQQQLPPGYPSAPPAYPGMPPMQGNPAPYPSPYGKVICMQLL